MKKLFIIALMLLSINLFGQNFNISFNKSDSVFTKLYNFKTNDHIVKIDTIKVKALCSYDCDYSNNYSELKIEHTFVTNLLQIRKHYFPYHPDYMIIDEKPSIEIIGYLYENKIKLQKDISIWMCK